MSIFIQKLDRDIFNSVCSFPSSRHKIIPPKAYTQRRCTLKKILQRYVHPSPSSNHVKSYECMYTCQGHNAEKMDPHIQLMSPDQSSFKWEIQSSSYRLICLMVMLKLTCRVAICLLLVSSLQSRCYTFSCDELWKSYSCTHVQLTCHNSAKHQRRKVQKLAAMHTCQLSLEAHKDEVCNIHTWCNDSEFLQSIAAQVFSCVPSAHSQSPLAHELAIQDSIQILWTAESHKA